MIGSWNKISQQAALERATYVVARDAEVSLCGREGVYSTSVSARLYHAVIRKRKSFARCNDRAIRRRDDGTRGALSRRRRRENRPDEREQSNSGDLEEMHRVVENVKERKVQKVRLSRVDSAILF